MLDFYIKFIYKTSKLHPIKRDVISIFVYDFIFETYKYYNISHPDLPVNYSLDQFKKDYFNFKLVVNNKKEYKYFIPELNLYDVGILYFINSGEVLPNYINENYEYDDNDGYITPFVKHQEIFLEEINDIKDIISKFNVDKLDQSYHFYEKTSDILYYIEKNGLSVDKEYMKEYFPDATIYDNDLVYSSYNILNITGRPSNAFNKINFVAIPKNNKSRKAFISRYVHGNLLLMDFTGYHPTIVSKMINYNIPDNETIYEHLGKLYLNKFNISDYEIQYIKKVVMINLYGDNINSDVVNLDYFKKIDQLKDKFWKEYNENGYILTPIYNRKLEYDIIGEISKSKLFSYIIQAYETELNIDKINKCIKYCQSMTNDKILPILYVYDSLLFDIPSKIEKKHVINLKNILEEGNFKLKCYVGTDYNDMVKINI